MIVLGIDPGFGTMGYGVVEGVGDKKSLITYGAVKTKSDMPFIDRLLVLESEINKLFDEYKPEAVAIEELFFNNNAKTAIQVAEARGVILTTCKKRCEALFEFTPLQIKQALTGYGRADKHQIQHMTKALLKLKEVPKPDDAADAVAVALCFLQAKRFGNLFKIK